MSQFTKLFAAFVLSTMTLTACVPAPTEDPEMEEEIIEDEEMMEEEMEEDMEEEDSMVEVEVEASRPVLEDAQYLSYSSSTYNELNGSEPFALFFHAEWCPTCKALEADIDSSLSGFAPGVKIVEANFDTETELRKTYGVNVQSTVVIIDANGNKVKTLAAPSAAEVEAELSALL